MKRVDNTSQTFKINDNDKRVGDYVEAYCSKTKELALYNIKTNNVITGKPHKITYIKMLPKLNLIVMEDDNYKVKVFDVLKDEFIVENGNIKPYSYHDSNPEISFEIIYPSEDGKKHILNVEHYRDKDKLEDIGYDNVEYIFSERPTSHSSYTEPFVATLDGKKSLYFRGRRTEIKYDDAKYIRDSLYDENKNFLLYYEDGKEYFELWERNKELGKNIIGPFDKITYDDDYIYCNKNGKIYCYEKSSFRNEPIFEVEANSIKMIGSHRCGRDKYANFDISRKGKHGVIEADMFSEKCKIIEDKDIILPLKYDSIDDNGSYPHFLKLLTIINNKCGLFIKNENTNQTLEPTSDSIDQLDDYTYILHNGTLMDIIRIVKDKPKQTVISDVEELTEIAFQTYRYKKNNKFGVFVFFDEKFELTPPEYDGARYKENAIILENGDREGLYCKHKIMLPAKEYNKIDIKYYREPYNYKYLISAKKNNDYYLGVIISNKDELFIDTSKKYKNIKFFNNFLLLVDDEYSNIYDYKGKLIKSTSAKTPFKIKEIEDNNGKELYIINGEYYYFEKQKLKKVNSKFITGSVNINTATYETEDYIYEISSSEENTLNYFCDKVDSLSDHEGKKYLEKVTSSIDEHLQLVLKKINKRKK